METQNPSDSSESPEKEPTKSDTPSAHSISEQWKLERRRVLALHQAKAERVFTVIKAEFPDENLFSLQLALLTLLIPLMPTDSSIFKQSVTYLARLADVEIELGLSSLKEKSSEADTIPEDAGGGK